MKTTLDPEAVGYALEAIAVAAFHLAAADWAAVGADAVNVALWLKSAIAQ